MSLLSDMLKENINIRMQSVCAATMYDVAGVHYLITNQNNSTRTVHI